MFHRYSHQLLQRERMGMGWASVLVALICILLPHGGLADGFLSPLLSPLLNETCKVVKCGKGSCQPSLGHAFGFMCDCDPGWTQLHIDDHLRFLPCVVPNCSLNYSCSNDTMPPATPPSPSPSDQSMFDPCSWSFCGGGSCRKTSTFEHQCDCKEGYSNLLNVTSFPCFRDCSIGGDCAKLGITVSNSSSSSPSDSVQGSSAGREYSALKNLPWLFLLMASLTMVQAT